MGDAEGLTGKGFTDKRRRERSIKKVTYKREEEGGANS